MPHHRTLVVVLAALIAGPACAQSIKPMSPDAIARIGSPTATPAPAPAAVSTQAPRVAFPAPAPVGRAPVTTVTAPAPAPLTTVTAPTPLTTAPYEMAPRQEITKIPAGTRLSEALELFVKARGWSMRWLIDEDYMLDADLPVPAGDVIEAVTWVVQTYQRQGGMRGVVPLFAKGNKVVAIQKMDVRDVE